MTEFELNYENLKKSFDGILDSFCAGLDCKPEILKDSLIYSLRLGGKRILPVLMFSVGKL